MTLKHSPCPPTRMDRLVTIYFCFGIAGGSGVLVVTLANIFGH